VLIFSEGLLKKTDYYPLTFRWLSDDFNPNCLVEYYYFGKDSIAKVIVYNWDIMNDVNNLKTGKSKILEQQNRKKEYLKKYNLIYNIVVEKFGKPTKEEKVKESNDGFFGNATWDTNGKIIELFFSFTPKVKELGEFAFGTFRVRLIIDNN
jgi:hypothetical protein